VFSPQASALHFVLFLSFGYPSASSPGEGGGLLVVEAFLIPGESTPSRCG